MNESFRIPEYPSRTVSEFIYEVVVSGLHIQRQSLTVRFHRRTQIPEGDKNRKVKVAYMCKFCLCDVRRTSITVFMIQFKF